MDYYSPQKNQENIQLEQQVDHVNLSNPQIDKQYKMKDFSESHRNAIRTLDIGSTIGTYPVFTFKKVYGVGVQLGSIYNDITHKIIRYGPQSPHSNNETREWDLKLWVLFSPLFLRDLCNLLYCIPMILTALVVVSSILQPKYNTRTSGSEQPESLLLLRLFQVFKIATVLRISLGILENGKNCIKDSRHHCFKG